jgi:hypothetical protein
MFSVHLGAYLGYGIPKDYLKGYLGKHLGAYLKGYLGLIHILLCKLYVAF